MDDIVYQITEAQCQANIDTWADGVCPGCGGKVTPIETVNNSDEPTFWAGCLSCGVFTAPVMPTIYRIADQLVRVERQRYYSHSPQPDERNEAEYDYWLRSQRRGMAGLVQRIIRLNAESEANDD